MLIFHILAYVFMLFEAFMYGVYILVNVSSCTLTTFWVLLLVD